jgi:hypothetical protein
MTIGEEGTFPKAPFPTHLRSMKWKRLTSASKSMTLKGRLGRNRRRKERANLRTTAKGAHVDGLNELQIDCTMRGIQGSVKERNELRTKNGGR